MNIIIPVNTTLFNGSSKLYKIQNYIKHKKHLIYKYVDIIHSHTYKDIDAYFIQNYKRDFIIIFDNYMKYMPSDINSQIPINKECMVLYLLDFMFKNNTIYKLSQIYDSVKSNINYRRYKNSYTELYNFILYIESLDRHSDINLEVQFFSVFRMNIQFFSSKEVALLYSNNSESKLYKYTLNTELKLLDLFNVKYIDHFVKNIFTNGIRYTDKIIEYYTEYNYRQLQHLILNELLQPLKQYNSDFFDSDSYKSIQSYTKYKFDLYDKLHTSFDDPLVIDKFCVYFNTYDYYIIIDEIVNYLVQKQNYIYTELLESYNLKDSNELCKIILSKFKTIESLKSESFVEFFDIVYWNKYFKVMNLKEQYNKNYYTQIFDNLKYLYKLQYSKTSDYTQMTQKFIDDLNSDFLELDCILNWSTYFEIDLISETGIYLFTNYNILNNYPIRISIYNTDALLCYTLINSTYFIKYNYNGWYNSNIYEIMLYDPLQYGNIVKYNSYFSEFEEYDLVNY